MTTKVCPNCGSENIDHVNTGSYDLGYEYTCYDCSHDFDDPSTVGDEDQMRGVV